MFVQMLMLTAALTLAAPETAEIPTRWVAPVEVVGPYFSDEVAAIHDAIVARLKRDRGVRTLDAATWKALAAAGKTHPDGPVCARAPDWKALVSPRTGAESVNPVWVDGQLTFQYLRRAYSVRLNTYQKAKWVEAIASVQSVNGLSLRRSGRGFLSKWDTITASIKTFGAWAKGPDPGDVPKALDAAFQACRTRSPQRPVGRSIWYRVIVDIGPDGVPQRAEDAGADDVASVASRACVEAALMAQNYPAAIGERRLIVTVIDWAPTPTERVAWLGIHLTDPPPFISPEGFGNLGRFKRCGLPERDTAFTIGIDARGAVVEAGVEGLDEPVATCLMAALKRVKFPCPEGGTASVHGTFVR